MFGLKKRTRQRLIKQQFPDQWLAILNKNVPYFRHLPAELQTRLKGLTTVFLEEQTFEGCAGLKITDEIRVTIAAQASVLMLGIDNISYFYEGLRSILVYPKSYIAKVKRTKNSFFVEEGFQPRHGEAWSHGNVVLAWDEVKRGASDIHDGHNLVFHEFAHQLDYEYGATNQTDLPNDESSYLSWAWVISNEYSNFLKALQEHRHTLINEYGAKNLAEFFAVVTEYFFEKPAELRKNHPELYQQFTEFYRQDPASYLN